MSDIPIDLELTNERIVLRAPQPGDAQALWEAVRDSMDELHPWMPWSHARYSTGEALAWINKNLVDWKKGSAYDFCVLDRTAGHILGCCGLNHIQPEYRMANLGYWVHSAHTGNEVATDAVRLLARFAFDHLQLNRIEIIMAEDNAASARVAEKAGAQFEGKVRNRLILRDGPVTALLYSLVPEDL